MADDDVQLTDLEVIQQFSLAVRGATATRAQVIAALEADLAFLQGSRRRTSSAPAPVKPSPVSTTPIKRAPARATLPVTKPGATKAAAKAPVTAVAAKKAAGKKLPAKKTSSRSRRA